jgi:hypothetical protein
MHYLFQFISIINLYIFRAVLLLIIRRYYSVYTAIGVCDAAKRHKIFCSAQYLNYSNNDIKVPSLLSWHHIFVFIVSTNTQSQKHTYFIRPVPAHLLRFKRKNLCWN